jgi:hypothetical protein
MPRQTLNWSKKCRFNFNQFTKTEGSKPKSTLVLPKGSLHPEYLEFKSNRHIKKQDYESMSRTRYQLIDVSLLAFINSKLTNYCF